LTDGDYWWDANETSEHVMFFEAEDFVDEDRQYYGGAVQPAGESSIFDAQFPVVPDSDDEYVMFVRAKCLNESVAYPELELYIDGDKVSEHYVDTEYKWFQTGEVTPGTATDYINFKAVDVEGDNTTLVDKIIIIKADEDPQNNGQYTMPYSSDTDGDGLEDGVEVTDGKYWYEAEEYFDVRYGTETKDVIASNGITVESGSNTAVIVAITHTFTEEDYLIFV